MLVSLGIHIAYRIKSSTVAYLQRWKKTDENRLNMTAARSMY